MSVFGLTSYASIDEVWGTPQFSPAIENIHATQGHQSTILSKSKIDENVKESNDAQCARHVITLYKKEGLVGIRRVIDPVIIREIQTQAIRKYSNTTTTMMGTDELLFIVLALLSIVFAMDS